MSDDWTGQNAIEDAKDAGEWFRDRKRPNIIERLKELIEKMKDRDKGEKKIPPERESLEEAINDAAEYLRNKKGDIENVSDVELEGALNYVLSGKPVTYQESDTFLGGGGEKPEKEEQSTTANTFFSEGPPSDSIHNQLTKIRPPKSNEDNPDQQQIAAADQGLFKDPQGNVVDKEMTPMKWDGKQWVPDTEKKPKYGSFFQ